MSTPADGGSGGGGGAASGERPTVAQRVKRGLTRVCLVIFVLPFALLLSLNEKSWRIVSVTGGEAIDDLARAGTPMVAAFWHDAMVPCGGLLRSRLKRAGARLAILASRSRDGDIAATLARLSGIHVVRGSTSRGGLQSLFTMNRLVRKDRCTVFMAPDGPRGPAYVAKSGAVVLAGSSGAPLVAMACAVERAWRFGSWDRLMLPQPFTRVALAFEPPLIVAKGLKDEALRSATEALGASLIRASERARAALG